MTMTTLSNDFDERVHAVRAVRAFCHRRRCHYVSIDLYLCKMHWSAKTRFQELRTKNQCGKKQQNFFQLTNKKKRDREKRARIQYTHTHNPKSSEKLMLCNFQHVKPQSDMKALGFLTKVDAKLSIFDLFIEVLFVFSHSCSSCFFILCRVVFACAFFLFLSSTLESNVQKLNFTLKRCSVWRWMQFGECNTRSRAKIRIHVGYLFSFDIHLFYIPCFLLKTTKKGLKCNLLLFSPWFC